MAIQYYNNKNLTLALWTEGDQYQTDLYYTGESYEGYYHIENGYLYTDPAPIIERQPLYPYVTNDRREVRKYNVIKDTTTPNRPAPRYHFPKPTTDDISQGWMVRFFVQRLPDHTITEIDLDQYQKVGTTNGIDKALYNRASIRWKIGGTDVSIKFINSGKLQTMDNTMPGISDYLNNLLEFSEYSPVWAKQ
jgi:hypothetical protein